MFIHFFNYDFIFQDFEEGTKTIGIGEVKYNFFHSSKAYLTLQKGDEVDFDLQLLSMS